MGWNDISRQGNDLKRELVQLEENDARAERERADRQKRRAEILMKLGWIDAIEQMVSRLAEPGDMPSLIPPSTSPRRPRRALQTRAAYGSVKKTIMSVMETKVDASWAPPEVGETAKELFDVDLKLASIRSNLKRMAEEGKVVREGDRYRLGTGQGSPFGMFANEPADAA
jgi:hypothetical protein